MAKGGQKEGEGERRGGGRGAGSGPRDADTGEAVDARCDVVEGERV